MEFFFGAAAKVSLDIILLALSFIAFLAGIVAFLYEELLKCLCGWKGFLPLQRLLKLFRFSLKPCSTADANCQSTIIM